MARNIGPEMLETLDEARSEGKLSQAEYEARKAEVLELIRKGKAVEFSALDKLVKAFIFALAIFVGGWFIVVSTKIAGVLIGIAIIVGGILMARSVGRRAI